MQKIRGKTPETVDFLPQFTGFAAIRLHAYVALLAVVPLSAWADDALDAAFERDVLIVAASAHACYRFDIYLALNDEQRRRGLMHVRQLAATTGMLFVYDSNDYVSMWMKNTFIPLDMIFARADGTVASVVRDTEPQSLRPILADEPVRFVLELNAGTARALAIDEGSRLLWRDTYDPDE